MPSCLHLIRVAGHLGVRLPATPPPLPRPDGGGQPWPCACAPYRAPCLMQQTGTSMMSGTEHMSTRTTERQAQSLPISRIRIPTRAMALNTRTTERQAQSLPINRIRKTTRTVALSTRTTERQAQSLPKKTYPCTNARNSR